MNGPPQSERPPRQEGPPANATPPAAVTDPGASGTYKPCRVCPDHTATGIEGICRRCALKKARGDAELARTLARDDLDTETRALTRARAEQPERCAAWRHELRRLRDVRRYRRGGAS